MHTVSSHDRPIDESEFSPPRSPSHRLTLSPSYSRRRAFTLLEAMLASIIGTVLLFAGLGLITTLERTDRSLAVRADESASLQRMRLVFQRAFDSILVASRPTTSRVATAVATPAPGNAVRPANRAGGADPASPDPAASTPTTPTSPSDTTKNVSTASQATSATSSPATSTAKGAPTPLADPSNSRVFLHYDALTVEPMAGTPGAGLLGLIRPQRLEMVLTDSPVPARHQDPFVLAHALAKEQRLSRRTDSTDTELSQEPATDQPAPASAQAAPTDEESQEPALRAVRGAFEMVPQPTNPSDDNGTLWELWWVPRTARRSLDEVRHMGRVLAEAELAGTGEPYRIAGDIRALRIRAFDDREKKEVYSAVVQSQLPAYAEVEVEMRSGRTAQWLFEISWATGPETREQAQNAQTGRAGPADAGREQPNPQLNYEQNRRQKSQKPNPTTPQTK